MEPIEEIGKTIEEATQKALEKLGIKLDEAKVEILERPSKGLFGLGAKLAKVRVTPQWNKDFLDAARTAKDILNLMGFPNNEVRVYEEEGRIHLDIKGDGSGILIGRRGTTLNALQFIIELILSKKKGRKSRVIVDTEGYRLKRRNALVSLAKRMATQVKRERKEVALGPMNPYERHIIHSTLQHDYEVKTISSGEGDERQIIIIPKEKEGSDA